MNSLKDQLHEIAERLPESATWQDVLYEIHVRTEVERGLDDARNGRLASDEQVSSIYRRHGVRDESQVDKPRS